MTSASSGASSQRPRNMRMFGSPPITRCFSSSGRWNAFFGARSRNSVTQSANQTEAPMA